MSWRVLDEAVGSGIMSIQRRRVPTSSARHSLSACDPGAPAAESTGGRQRESGRLRAWEKRKRTERVVSPLLDGWSLDR